MFRKWFILVVCLLTVQRRTDSACTLIPTLLICQYSLPTIQDLSQGAKSMGIIIQNFKGNLTLDGKLSDDERGVTSIQILRSTIGWIQPTFFARLSNKKLKKLTLASVNGTLNLDYSTLDGLEDSLEELRVNDYHLGNSDHLYNMNKLKSLYLVRTGMSSLPLHFALLMQRLTNVDLSSNQLERIPWNTTMARVSMPQFQYLKLAGNKWECDCDMKPVVEAPVDVRRKIVDLVCAKPMELVNLAVTSLTAVYICPNETPPETASKTQPSEIDGVQQRNVIPVEAADQRFPKPVVSTNEPQVATAGSVSTEVIAIVVAVIFVILIVMIAVIVFKIRSKRQQRPPSGSAKKPSHKSSAYCSVIEHPTTKQTPPAKNSSSTAPPTQANPNVSPAYSREFETNERQPMVPSYYAQQDNRL